MSFEVKLLITEILKIQIDKYLLTTIVCLDQVDSLMGSLLFCLIEGDKQN